MQTKAQLQQNWLGHPRGLFVLFLTEMWERFSYYGMRVLLVLYMTESLFVHAEQGKKILGYETLKHMIDLMVHALGFPGAMTTQVLSSWIYGLYTGFVYLTPVFGGLLADKVLGQRKSVYVGGILMAIGHFLMASEQLFFLALLFLIVGNGCFKPNISTQVGGLYEPGDSRRDGAFAIFYMGINLGATFSPLVCGTLGQKVGWHYGFGAAGVGMILGLIIYYFGRNYLPQDKTRLELQAQQKGNERLTSREWGSIAAIAFLCFVNVVFWAVYEQQGNTLQLWAEHNTDLHVLGFEIPSSWFQVFNGLFIFLFIPVMTRIWTWQAKRGQEPTSITKMGIGCFLLGFGFVIMILATSLYGDQVRLSPLWLIGTTFIVTIGEIYLSPMGLSFVTKVAPARLVSTMMGIWLMSSFFGNIAAGIIGGFYEVMPKQAFFSILLALGVGAGFIFLIVQRPLKRFVSEVPVVPQRLEH